MWLTKSYLCRCENNFGTFQHTDVNAYDTNELEKEVFILRLSISNHLHLTLQKIAVIRKIIPRLIITNVR